MTQKTILAGQTYYFFGIKDVNGKSWMQFELQVVSLCATKLGFTINSSNYGRAHTGIIAGWKEPSYNHQVFQVFKDKVAVLFAMPKLKDAPFSSREDFQNCPPETFGRAQEALSTSFRIHFDKLSLNNNLFVYDSVTDNVREQKL